MKTFKGKPITLLGNQLHVGDQAPDFKAVNENFEDVSLKDFKNDYIVLNVVPSLDTPVCDLQTKTVNEELLKHEELDIKVITLSNDLPFAQSRWCEKQELEGITVLSDYLYQEFGNKYGLLIKENHLLARTAIILNAKREIIFEIHSDEMSQHLDYDKILEFIKNISKK